MRRDPAIDYHLARLLLLLKNFGTARHPGIKGLTKLAKLDFLLRYPSFTQKLLEARDTSWPENCAPTSAEAGGVEARMIRYKYGPWDDLYYPLLGALVGMGLAVVERSGASLIVRLTEAGLGVAGGLASTAEWSLIDERAAFLRTVFDQTGSALKTMIYRELPEVVDRPHRVEI